MIVIMKAEATEDQIEGVISRIREEGLNGHLSQGVERTIIGVVGEVSTKPQIREWMERMPGVEDVVPISKQYKLSSREFQEQATIVDVRGVTIGGNALVVMAGPCAVESEEQILSTAWAVKEAGANILRGGAYKPSTSPYSFRGLGEEGLKLLALAREETGLPIVTEVLTPEDVDTVAGYADILQIGARNMQNSVLLDEAGKSMKPVLLKRGISATIQEWLLAAEYILSKGNRQLILCERGIRTFETYTRNTMDIAAIPIIERDSHLPIIADPSHGTGKWYLVTSLALAAVAAGADGLIVETHPNPDAALKDGPQSLTFDNFQRLMDQVRSVATAVGRTLAVPPPR
ncbi:MAG: 3-deoxy-7-phosphoheptulonate synthase [Dehalococcoidia bacterium]|nr:3-deoxy-7-phosphoheptulonate synthase [Dehalococcoidia bacterium]MDP6782695.1 3-deoxy-7-phosphoheptulonate synthase [Dehalococcoidia bacterium]